MYLPENSYKTRSPLPNILLLQVRLLLFMTLTWMVRMDLWLRLYRHVWCWPVTLAYYPPLGQSNLIYSTKLAPNGLLMARLSILIPWSAGFPLAGRVGLAAARPLIGGPVAGGRGKGLYERLVLQLLCRQSRMIMSVCMYWWIFYICILGLDNIDQRYS